MEHPIFFTPLEEFAKDNIRYRKSEQDEQTGFKNVLCGLIGMFRNPEAHEPKIEWPIEEQDALEILGMISYCHRRLDKAQKIRME